jgi:predicted nucleic acid-binding protein
MIAGVVAAHKANLATRNTKDFANAGIPLIAPWQSDSPKP